MPIGGQTRGEWIPSIPDAPQPDKFGREAARTVREHRNDAETRTAFYLETGELHFQLFKNLVEPENHNKTIAWFRKLHGRDAVRTIVLWVAPVTYEERFPEFEFQNFKRTITRERVDSPQFCLTQSPARYWRVPRAEVDESLSSEEE